jgi:hypothetical protein
MANKTPAPRALAAVKAGPPAEPIDKQLRITAKVRRAIDLMAWLATSGSYEDLVRMREREKRKKEAEKAKQPRRVRLPGAKPKD